MQIESSSRSEAKGHGTLVPGENLKEDKKGRERKMRVKNEEVETRIVEGFFLLMK